MTDTMAARVRAALTIAPNAVPARFADAYHRGGTPTSVHLVALAAAAGTTPIWLMTGWPQAHTLPADDPDWASKRRAASQEGV